MTTVLELIRGIEESGGKIARKDGEPCFVLHGGMHSRVKYDFERVFQHYCQRKEFAEALAILLRNIQYMPDSPLSCDRQVSLLEVVDVLAGAISMGPFLSSMQYVDSSVDSSIAQNKYMRLALAKKKDGVFIFDENCDLREDDRILFVDDVLTTGTTLIALTDALRRWYANRFSEDILPHMVGSAVLLDRGAAKWCSHSRPQAFALVPHPFFSLLQDSDSTTYNAHQCPHCSKR